MGKDPAYNVGYVQLTGFTGGAGRELQTSVQFLERKAAQRAAQTGRGSGQLDGLVLDLRGNPGGLLQSAVEVSSLLVPPGETLVTARGRAFDTTTYKSAPVQARRSADGDASAAAAVPVSNGPRLAVLVNGATASAAEIVSGAVQDLDSGVIVGDSKTFGKGLIQSIERLPYDTALKYTVGKYYTPSGRCIQGLNYKAGGKSAGAPAPGAAGATNVIGGGDGAAEDARAAKERLRENGDLRFSQTKTADADRAAFKTRNGRTVRDGGGIEPDVTVPAAEISPLEYLLVQQGAVFDFASQYAATHDNAQEIVEACAHARRPGSAGIVTDAVYADFTKFALDREKAGDLVLADRLYSKQLGRLDAAFDDLGYTKASATLKSLKKDITAEVRRDFGKHRQSIGEAIESALYARYVPESLVLRHQLFTDKGALEAVAILEDPARYAKLLAGNKD